MAAASVCIMVIDANAHMRRLIGTVLGALPDAVVVEARSPIAARSLMAEHLPHLVIMDWSGDHTDGVLFVHHLRRGDMGRRDVPVLALSTTLHHAVLEQALESGIDDVIAKPISAMEIIDRAGALIQFDRRRAKLSDAAAAE
jgi:CheY-like chemotaxis protein